MYIVEYTYIFFFCFAWFTARLVYVAYVENNNTYIYFVVLILFFSLYYHDPDPLDHRIFDHCSSSGINHIEKLRKRGTRFTNKKMKRKVVQMRDLNTIS